MSKREKKQTRGGPTGLSLHIGVNRFDPLHYGTTGDLPGCENDARAMHAIARGLGYRSEVFLTQDATSRNVLSFLDSAAKTLVEGDILFVTYAGHGAQVPDVTGDEDDGQDETWCLYDRMLVDDELYGVWGRIRAGVRIVMVSDSCHSGTMARFFKTSHVTLDAVAAEFDRQTPGHAEAQAYRVLHRQQALAVYEQHADAYQQIQQQWRGAEKSDISATVAFISACADNQLAADLGTHGRFTSELLKVWQNGRFDGTHHAMWKAISTQMPPTQSPKFMTFGGTNPVLDTQPAFTIQPTSRKGVHMSQHIDLDAEADRLIFGPRPGLGTTRSINGGGEQSRCRLEVVFPRALFNDLSQEEFAEFLKTEGCTTMMKAYLAAKSTTPTTRGGVSGEIRCEVDKSGGRCSGGIRFNF